MIEEPDISPDPDDYVIEYWKSRSKKRPYRAHLKCPGNGEILAPSQGYTRKASRDKTWNHLSARLGCSIVEIKK